jgi:hypothetical protein
MDAHNDDIGPIVMARAVGFLKAAFLNGDLQAVLCTGSLPSKEDHANVALMRILRFCVWKILFW